ncbi:MAG: hypothetical protein ACLR0P_13375 [Oscillospiraceae bacterium]
MIPAGVLLASSAALRFRFGPLVQQLRQLGQRHDRLRLPALADHGQCWGGCNAAAASAGIVGMLKPSVVPPTPGTQSGIVTDMLLILK